MRKFKNGKGQEQTTLSTNRLQNVFSRFQTMKTNVVCFSKMMPLNKKQNYGFTLPSLLKIGSLAMAQTYNVLTIPSATLGLLEGFNYATSIDFMKYGFFGKASRSFYNNRLALSFGLRADADSFTTGSSLLDNLSPRLAASYQLTENQRWKLNASVGRYFKILPTQC